MSSCKIIKAAMPAEYGFVKYSFEALPEMTEFPAAEETGEFQALFTATFPMGRETVEPGAATAPAEETQPENSPPPGPTDEELQQMLRESFDHGFAEGRQEAEELFNNACRTLRSAVAEVSGLKERLLRESEEDLLQLAIMVAKQIIKQEVSLDRKILAYFVSEATRGIMDQDDIVICFNPEDCRIVSANRHVYLEELDDKRQITLKPDDSVPVGGCVVNSSTGLVDASVEAQLNEVYKRLMQERIHGSDGALVLPMESEPYVQEQYGVENHGYPKN
jgi:flagellar assembly protein FliH